MNMNSNDNNGKPNEGRTEPKPVVDPLDLELEERLRRLRSDLTTLEDPPAAKQLPRAGLTQH
jgi:hypothetical protein